MFLYCFSRFTFLTLLFLLQRFSTYAQKFATNYTLVSVENKFSMWKNVIRKKIQNVHNVDGLPFSAGFGR